MWVVVAAALVFASWPALTTAKQAQSLSGTAEQSRLLAQGRALLAQHNASDAISRYFDVVIAHFESAYIGTSPRVYCARYAPEAMQYMLSATRTRQRAIVLPPTWADAYFMRSYALTELGRSREAKDALLRALALSPSNSQYLSELGHLHQRNHDWAESVKSFQSAAAATQLIPEGEERVGELGKALRGEAFSRVEMRDYASAIELYRACLALNPRDAVARSQLKLLTER